MWNPIRWALRKYRERLLHTYVTRLVMLLFNLIDRHVDDLGHPTMSDDEQVAVANDFREWIEEEPLRADVLAALKGRRLVMLYFQEGRWSDVMHEVSAERRVG